MSGADTGRVGGGETLALPARVDAQSAPALFRAWAPRASTLSALDFAAVTNIDSAGVAMVRVLQRLVAQQGRELRLEARPARFDQLCLAHRLDPTRH